MCDGNTNSNNQVTAQILKLHQSRRRLEWDGSSTALDALLKFASKIYHRIYVWSGLNQKWRVVVSDVSDNTALYSFLDKFFLIVQRFTNREQQLWAGCCCLGKLSAGRRLKSSGTTEGRERRSIFLKIKPTIRGCFFPPFYDVPLPPPIPPPHPLPSTPSSQ